jgi:hypothetical protein
MKGRQVLMSEQGPRSKSVFTSIWLLLTLLVLLGSLCPACAAPDATYYPSDYYVSNGTYISGSVPSSLRTVDSDYFTVAGTPLATSSSSYSPTAYTLSGGTSYISGATGDLASSNDVSMVYRSYPTAMSAQALYTHQEVTTIAGSTYNVQRPESADMPGISLSASMATIGRQLLGKFVYPLSGLSSIPASTWTGNYRAWRDPDSSIAYDSTGSGNNGDGASNITWTHVVGSGTNRFMMIGISIRVVTVSALSVTVGGQSATFLRSDSLGAEVKGETWYLINPGSGSKIVTVTLSGSCKASGGSVSYSGVAQTDPVDNHVGASYSGVTPSVSLTTTVDNDWIFSNLAVSGAATIVAHGSGQVHRYYQIGTGGSGPSRPAADDGDDKPTTTPSLYKVSWNMSFFIDTVAQAVAFKPAPRPVGHIDIDVLIRKSDGAIRTTLASGVADSTDLTSTPATLSGLYSMAAYSVVDQSDYLEIDYYVNVTSATSGVAAYLRIGDNSLPAVEQTRMANVMLPSEYSVEVEFAGLSNSFTWTQISWTVEAAWSSGSVATTLQLYNYALSNYPTSGDGFISYTSNATAGTDESRTQTVATNPVHFRNSTGGWRIKIKGVKTSTAPFDFKGDWIELRSTYYSEYAVSAEFQFLSIANDTMTQLNFTVVSECDVADVYVIVQAWNYSASAYVNTGQGYLGYSLSGTNNTQVLSIDVNPQFYAFNGSARILITSLSTTTTLFRQRVNQIKLDCKSVRTLSPFTWLMTFLVALAIPLVVLLFWFVTSRRRNNAKWRILKKATAFSKQFGINHEKLVGRKILLEVDPASDYNVALSGFVSEAKNNGEPLFIVTNKNSALHSVFSSTGDANFLLLASKIHYSQQINEKETILPASDVSILLDACVKIQESHHDKTLNLLFDNVSDIVFRCGIDKTYKFIRMLLEALSSSDTTALFVFIPTAHDQETTSSIRGLFQTQLNYTKDGPKT